MSREDHKDEPGTGTPTDRSDMPGRSVLLRHNRVESRDLFTDTREITIGHGEETYRLRLTAQNKLILTK
jgi:hemin uptake protein HemP